MKIIAQEISSKHFSYNGKTSNFVAEASELPKSFNPMSPIYNDACDRGFYMVSEKTGEKLLFTFSHTVEDVAGWWFKVVPTVLTQNNPKLCKIRVLIIND